MSDAEVKTIAIVAAMYFGGKQALARLFLKEQGYLKHTISRSRLCRRLERVKHRFLAVFKLLGEAAKAQNVENICIIVSLPVAVCDNYRIRRCSSIAARRTAAIKRSRSATSMASRFTGGVTHDGHAVKFLLSPGAFSDTAALHQFDFDLPPAAWIVGDKAYNVYLIEDVIAECDLFLMPIRKENSKRPWEGWLRYLLSHYRKRVETAVSQIERLVRKHIHAVTDSGLEFKTILFVLASAIFSAFVQ